MKINTPLQQALHIALNLNLPVFPCRPDKRPYTKNGFKDATIDMTKIKNFWLKFPDALIGVPTGKISNLFVIDVDMSESKSGENTFEKLGFEDPDTLQTITKNKGRHLIFKYDETIPQKNTVQTLFGKDIDTRGDNGYIIWAGSPGYKYREGYDENTKNISKLPEEIKDYIIKKSKSIPIGKRNNDLFQNAVTLVNKGVEDHKVIEATNVLNEYCEAPLLTEERTKIIKSALNYRQQNLSNYKTFPTTDLGNGERFARDHKGDALYCIDQKTWYAFNKGVWLPHATLIDRMAKTTARNIHVEVSYSSLYEHSDHIKKWQKTSENISRQKAMIDAAKQYFEFSSKDFDKNKYLINFKNCTYDLSTHKSKQHNAKDYITKNINYDFNPDAKCDRWISFLEEITLDDKELENYLQKLCGYILCGERYEQIVVFIVGSGANGKSVFLNVLSKLFGDYASFINSSSVIYGNNSTIPNDIAGLYGKRLVSLSEFPERSLLNTTLLKSMSGGDNVLARKLYQDWFEFNPEFQLICAMNEIPEIKEDDEAFLRRLKVIEFNANFKEDKIDKNLTKKLFSEIEGIMNWAIEGYKLYQKHGLKDIDHIRSALNKFIDLSNPLNEFFKSNIKVTYNDKDVISVQDMHDYSNDFSKKYYDKFIEKSTLCKFFKKKNFPIKQKRFSYNRVNCFIGLKYLNTKDEVSAF